MDSPGGYWFHIFVKPMLGAHFLAGNLAFQIWKANGK